MHSLTLSTNSTICIPSQDELNEQASRFRKLKMWDQCKSCIEKLLAKEP